MTAQLPKVVNTRWELEQEGLGPDDVHVEFRSESALKILPPLKLAPRLSSDKYNVYSSDIRLVHPEEYSPSAVVQFGRYDWLVEAEDHYEEDQSSLRHFLNTSIPSVLPSTIRVVGNPAYA